MSRRVLMIDNYDSFTYNLVQSLQVLGGEVAVYRNDQITVDEALGLDPTHVVISPGPGRPEDAGVSMDIIGAVLGRIPLLGVCLGHQALARVLGGQVVHAPRLMHGKASPVYHDGETIFRGLSNPLEAGRYHSLVVPEDSLPDSLTVTATTAEGVVMAVRHRSGLAEGVQFHPESILTPEGDRLLGNFLRGPEAGARA